MHDKNSLSSFFQQNVIDTFEDFLAGLENKTIENRCDIKRMGLAAEACLHFADIAFEATWLDLGFDRSKGRTAFTDFLTETRPYFALVRDIANVHKHGRIKRSGRRIEDQRAFLERWTITRFDDEQGQYGQTGKVVQIKLLNGEIHFAETIIGSSIYEWSKFLVDAGVLTTTPRMRWTPRRYFSRSETTDPPEITMRLRYDQHFMTQPEFMRWNASSNSLERATRQTVYTGLVKIFLEALPSRFSSTSTPAAKEIVIEFSHFED